MEFSDEEVKILKEVVKREETVSRVWGWIRSFLVTAVPLTTLYMFYDYIKAKH